MLRKLAQELVHRTGRNPQNLFIQLGCSKMAEQKMLHYVKAQCVGKPFSNYAMVRSLFWPRETDHTSFFCAGTRSRVARATCARADRAPLKPRRARRVHPQGGRAARRHLQPGLGHA